MNKKITEIENNLASGALDAVLQGYAVLFQQQSTFFTKRPYTSKNHLTHVQNAANLARKKLYDDLIPLGKVSTRIKAAIEHFTGARQLTLPSLQKPSYFYVPGLRDNAFYDESEFTGFAEIRKNVESLLDAYAKEQCQMGEHNYLDDFGNLPKTEQWHQLNQNNWLSTSLIKGGKKADLNDKRLQQIREIVSANALADCPPHAPEMFISVLKPGAYIPPHFGLSNVKVTAHLPFKVTNKAWLEVKGERRFWDGRSYLIFDDSLEHSAANEHDDERAVLIFDLWHPDLTQQERSAISEIVVKHESWHKQFGMLARVDRGTY